MQFSVGRVKGHLFQQMVFKDIFEMVLNSPLKGKSNREKGKTIKQNNPLEMGFFLEQT